jgi:fibronectin type 3 domain-containing protein
VHLHWSASNSQRVTGYNVYRSLLSGKSYVRLNAVPIEGLNYEDAGVSSGQTYYYVATAVDAFGNESANSRELAIKIP